MSNVQNDKDSVIIGKPHGFEYEDIINCPRPVSATRKHMSAMDRAAQFAPFAALTGLDEAMDDVADSVNDEKPEIVKIHL